MRRIAFAWALLLVVSACGGQVSPGGDGGAATTPTSSSGGSGSSGGEDGPVGSSSGVSVPLCPTDPPSPGTSCAAPGEQGCIYEINGGCASFLCTSGGTWQTTTEGC